MSLSLIVAMSRNLVIGKDNQLPWHLPEDLKHFKEITMGHPILMGRKTFESIGRALPGRKNIVITRNAQFNAASVTIAPSLEDALAKNPNTENFVIGGAEIYAQALPRADKLYITIIEQDFEGDTYFPEIDWENGFEMIEESETKHSKKNQLPYRFLVAKRKST